MSEATCGKRFIGSNAAPDFASLIEATLATSRRRDNDGKRKTLEALLVFKIAIDRDQKIELGSSESQQFAVF